MDFEIGWTIGTELAGGAAMTAMQPGIQGTIEAPGLWAGSLGRRWR